MKDIELVEGTKVDRDKYITRIDILEKVKNLNTLANTEYMTTNQVSEFYEVSDHTIRSIYKDHIDEINDDGVEKLKGGEIVDLISAVEYPLHRKTGYIILDGERLANSFNNLFSKRAVLRIGMLLRDSKVAKEVRTLLLNVYHDVEEKKENILEHIDDDYSLEIELQNQLGKSFLEGNMEDFAMTAARISNLLNKRIKELKPKAEYTEEVLKAENLFTVTQIAKDLGMSAVGLNALLHGLGVQYKQSRQWHLYSKYQNKGYTHSETYMDNSNQARMQTKWTQKGRKFIYDLLDREGLRA